MKISDKSQPNGNARGRVLRQALLVLALVLVPGGNAVAQPLPALAGGEAEESERSVDATAVESITERLAAARSELGSVERRLETGASRTPATARRDALNEIVVLLEAQLALAKAPVADPSSEIPDPSPSLFALNALYEARFAAELETKHRREQVDAARAALETAKAEVKRAAAAQREARAARDAATPETRAALERTFESAELAHRAARETVHLQTLKVRVAVAARDSGRDVEAIDEQIGRLREALAQGEGQSTDTLAGIAAREGELRRNREAVARRLANAEVRLQATLARFSRQEHPTAELIQEVEATTVRRDTIQQEIALADARLDRLAAERELWRQWEILIRGPVPDASALRAWEDEAATRLAALRQQEVRDAGRVSDVVSRLERLDDRLTGEIADPRLRDALAAEAQALRHLRDALRADTAAFAAERRFSERVLAAIRERTGHIDPLEYVSRGAKTAGEVWAYEITAVDDAPITVGSLFLALMFFGAGLWAARRGSDVVARVSENRFALDPGATHALRTLSFYGLLVGFSLLALRAVHFPLTAFTVLGGALAIGVGFGSQNVMNNFISGLILMLEQPVRARDVVEIDGNHGTIETIGARSTQIRSTDGRHIIVPNSFFLESNVVNWTRSDELMRAKVSVGVIYGSPTRLVEELIGRVVEEDDDVLKHPAPSIIFEEFGDNSLNFDVYFWIKARSPMEVRKVQSRVRFRIDDLFREDNLVIAFPQRDVHLDSVSPIEVRVVDRTEESQSPAE